MKNKKKGFIIPLLVTIIVLLAVGGGVYLYVSNDSNSLVANQDENAVATTSDSSLSAQSTTSVKSNLDEKLISNVETITLNNNSDGILRIERTFEYEESHKTQSKLVFTPNNSKSSFLVSIMPPGVTGLENNIVYDNKIYFVSNDNMASIKYFDLSSGKFETVEETIGKNAYISSINLMNGDLYYIAGSKEFAYCLDFPKDKCLNASLYKYNFNDDKVELLVENIKGSNILGADKKDVLYFSLSWGDAGAWFSKVYKYNNSKAELYKEYSEVDEVQYNSFINSLENRNKGYQSILLKNGNLLPGPSISEYSKNNYFFVGK
jgi:hypothetical protein